MNPNAQQALDDEEGINEIEQDLDYDTVYGGLALDVTDIPKSKELQNDYKKVFGDIAKQVAKETLIGLGGAYGDLFELAGLRKGQTEGSKTRNKSEFEALERMEQPGYKPSLTDIELISSDGSGLDITGAATSGDLREFNEMIDGPGEAETAPGKYAGRAAKIYGGGLAVGQVNPLPALIAGTAGQATEDMGGGPLAQAAAEIAGLLAGDKSARSLARSTGKLSLQQITSNESKAQKLIDEMRGLGYSEEDITLAVNSAYKNKSKTKIASRGQSTEDAFDNFATKSDGIVSDILETQIPGYERGVKKIHEMASDAYGQVAQAASNLTITNSKPFLDASKKVVDQLQNTLGKNPEAQAFIKRISEAAMDSTQYPSAEKMMNFYKELNSMGNWLGRSQKDRLITQVKDGIKNTFKADGKAGKELAEKFEKANQGIRKAYLAEDVSDVIQKATTAEKIDYKKLSKALEKPDNIKLFEEALGARQVDNIKKISNIGKEVGDFDKAWKKVNNMRLGTVADIARGSLGTYYILNGDWKGLAGTLASKASRAAIGQLAEKSLTDPKFQNLIIRGLHAVKTASPRGLLSVQEGLNKYLKEEGIGIDLD